MNSSFVSTYRPSAFSSYFPFPSSSSAAASSTPNHSTSLSSPRYSSTSTYLSANADHNPTSSYTPRYEMRSPSSYYSTEARVREIRVYDVKNYAASNSHRRLVSTSPVSLSSESKQKSASLLQTYYPPANKSFPSVSTTSFRGYIGPGVKIIRYLDEPEKEQHQHTNVVNPSISASAFVSASPIAPISSSSSSTFSPALTNPSSARPPILYFHKVSQPSRAVYMFCLFCNIEVEERIVDLANGDHKLDWFLEINPHGTVPVLDDNGFVLTESQSIMRYLAEKYQVADHWYPRQNLQQRAKINEYCDWHHTNLRKATVLFIFNKIFAKPGDAKKIEEGIALYHKCLSFLNNQPLKQHRFLCGDDPSIADVSAYAEIQQLPAFPAHFNLQEYPNVQRWMNDFESISNDKIKQASSVWNLLVHDLMDQI